MDFQIHINVNLSEKLIKNKSFQDCSSFTEITIPSSMTSIGNNSFYNCISLIKISFEAPSSITLIRKYSFYKCTSLVNVSILSSVTSIGD